MIIVSQDKDAIVNFNNINTIMIREHSLSDIIDKKDYKIISFDNTYRSSDDCSDVLGTYETEERAKEVLQGIIRAYEKAGNIMFETDEDERLLKLTHNSNVFEMPED